MKKTTDFTAHNSLIQAWDALLASVVGEKSFLSDERKSISYKEIHALAHCLGAYFISKNIQKQDVILIVAQNNIEACLIDLATSVCGVQRIFLSNWQDFDEVWQKFKPVCILISSEEIYTQNRAKLIEIADQTEILVEISDTQHIPEGEPIATIETILERGKIFWREHTEQIKERKNSIQPQDFTLIFKGLKGWNTISHALFLKGITIFSENFSTEDYPLVLSSVTHHDNLGMLAGWWMPLLTQKNIYLSDTCLLECFKKIRPRLWVASPQQVQQVQEQIQKQRWKLYAQSVLTSGQNLLKNRSNADENSFGLRLKCWSNGWYYRKLKQKYLKSIQRIVVKAQCLEPLTDAFYALLKTPIQGVWMEEGWAAPALMMPKEEQKIGSLGRVVFENTIQTSITQTSIQTKYFYTNGSIQESYPIVFEIKNANYYPKKLV